MSNSITLLPSSPLISALYVAQAGGSVIAASAATVTPLILRDAVAQSVPPFLIQDSASAELLQITQTGSIGAAASKVGFYGTAPIVKPTVAGLKGSNAALGSLMTALAALGIVVDTTGL